MADPTFEQTWALSIRRDAETVERIADRTGANRTEIANRAYELAAFLREWAEEIESVPPRGTCAAPPPGWWCSLSAGHDGPCPTRRDT